MRGAFWEDCYASALTSMGFIRGKGSPCCFVHPQWKVQVVVHGDDFTALGNSRGLDLYEAGMSKAFEIQIKGRLGQEKGDLKEMRVPNRILRVNQHGLLYEPDPRHAEMLLRALDLEEAKSVVTPGVKVPVEDVPPLDDNDADGEPYPVASLQQTCTRTPNTKKTQVTFDDNIHTIEITKHSDVYNFDIKNFLFSGPIGSDATTIVPDSYCPFTGLDANELRQRKAGCRADTKKRMHKLRDVLMNGAAWETSTTQVVFQLQAESRYKRKRVGAEAAKKLERLRNPSANLVGDDATLFRALAARANYSPLDRPDISCSTKELCRSFSSPTTASVQALKRLVRYHHGKLRMVWQFYVQEHNADNSQITGFVDTDFAGCLVTRRSTTGLAAMRGRHLIKHLSQAQSTVALSSAEAELTGICRGTTHCLGLQSIAADLGISLSLEMRTDAAAAIGVCRRRGLGKIRHLHTADLWIQDRLRAKEFRLSKVSREENPADILTKHIGKHKLQKHLKAMGIFEDTGRASTAPTIDHAPAQEILSPLVAVRARDATHRGGVPN